MYNQVMQYEQSMINEGFQLVKPPRDIISFVNLPSVCVFFFSLVLRIISFVHQLFSRKR